MTMKDLRYLGASVDTLFSKTFLNSQARASNVLLDEFKSAIRSDVGRGDFSVIVGQCTGSVPGFDSNRAVARGNGSAPHSYSYVTDDVPEILRSIIVTHRTAIERYIGRGFLYESPLYFRTLPIPDEFKTYDIYSNIWHQDSHDGNRLLKIFVLLMDVTDEDGPFHFLDPAATRRHWPVLRERWTFDKMKALPSFPDEGKATGKAGGYLILDTARCMHRASIPRGHRDMLQITLYPSWRVAPGRRVYNHAG